MYHLITLHTLNRVLCANFVSIKVEKEELFLKLFFSMESFWTCHFLFCFYLLFSVNPWAQDSCRVRVDPYTCTVHMLDPNHPMQAGGGGGRWQWSISGDREM